MRTYNTMSLAELSHIKIGGDTKNLFFPENYIELNELYQKYHHSHKIIPLGGCSNILFGNVDNYILISDKYLPWIFSVKKTDEISQLRISPNMNINFLIKKLAEYNLGGLEFLAGIPAHIGGLITMNAGAYQKQIGDYVSSIKIINNNGIKVLKQSDCDFLYRSSSIDGFIIEITLNVENINKENVLTIMTTNINKRKLSQPLNMPNLGCFFKNPKDDSAGRLIDSCGLKGYTIGDAMVSYEHANFLINKGNASFDDMLSLINFIKERVRDKYNINLELEVKVINE
ncbi:MAG: UDP-N-acetylmuramate dehydrogenase [Candidatus Cloacimonetes bacterium]|nr:UDP-N-acetylmuramate dehydrogenase [Candidatus Cloacimonadota bacterium]